MKPRILTQFGTVIKNIPNLWHESLRPGGNRLAPGSE